MLPATKRKSRTFATRETDVIFERKHCSRRRRHTQVEFSSSRKCADKTQTIARKRWHGARKRKRSNVMPGGHHQLTTPKAGHRSNLASLRFRVNAATERPKHTQVDFLWITQRFRTIAVFPINWERLDAGVFMPMLPATKRKSRIFATRETDVISERKHCSRRRRHTQVELSSPRKCANKTQTIARKRWHGARKRKRSNVRSTCGRLYNSTQLYLVFSW